MVRLESLTVRQSLQLLLIIAQEHSQYDLLAVYLPVYIEGICLAVVALS